MTTVYTAYWSATLSDPAATVSAAIAAEAAALRAPGEPCVITSAHTQMTESGGVLDLRAGVDTLSPAGEHEVTTVAVTARPGQRHQIRVTVTRPGSRGRSDAVAAPALVHQLLAAAPDAMRGDLKVSARPWILTGATYAEALAGAITAFDRSLPMVVFRHDRARGGTAHLDAVARAATSLAGAAQVIAIDSSCADAVTAALGSSYGLPAGTGLRVFLPDTDPAISADSTRHLSLSSLRIHADPPGTVRRAAAAVLAHATHTLPAPPLELTAA